MENENSEKQEPGYKQVLKPTFIMGGSTVINSLLAVVRIKVIALLLGPSGVGLIGIYQQVSSVVSTFFGMGINESGVRQIAEATGSDDQHSIARTVFVIRRTALVSGAIGTALLFLFRSHCSQITFGNPGHAKELAVLAASVIFAQVYGSQMALVQGFRKIADMAKVSIFGAFFGTVASIPIIYLFGTSGLPYYFVIVTGTGVITSWWYSRKISVSKLALSSREALSMAFRLWKFGVALMLGFFMSLLTAYGLRAYIARYHGLEAAGIYHAATTLSIVYVGVILQAMMTDYYPRLSAAADDHDHCRLLINKQIEVGLLLAFPGILGIMTFAPFVIEIFYSSKFTQSVEILRWQILGVLLQVVNYPMGFMLRAKAAGKLFFWTELFVETVLLTLSWVGDMLFGLPGFGMAFFGMNILYGILIYSIDHRYYSFSFSLENLKVLSMFAVATAIVFATPYFLPLITCTIVNSCITFAVGAKSVVELFSKSEAPGFLLKLKARFASRPG